MTPDPKLMDRATIEACIASLVTKADAYNDSDQEVSGAVWMMVAARHLRALLPPPEPEIVKAKDERCQMAFDECGTTWSQCRLVAGHTGPCGYPPAPTREGEADWTVKRKK